MLAAHGIFSLLDFHQDLYNEKFGGEGWPDWAVLDDGLPADPCRLPRHLHHQPGAQPRLRQLLGQRRRARGVGLQDLYAAAWARVAARFRGTAACWATTS